MKAILARIGFAIADLIGMALTVLMMIVLSPLIALVLIGVGIGNALDWLELHAVFRGDVAAHDKAKWERS